MSARDAGGSREEWEVFVDKTLPALAVAGYDYARLSDSALWRLVLVGDRDAEREHSRRFG